MRSNLRLVLPLAAAAALAAAPAASAQTVLLNDDMEGAIDAKWIVDAPTNPMLEPWQSSGSSAPKVRGNQAHGGAASYWAGPAPEGHHPADVVEGSITLTSKQPIVIPADGKTTVSYWSLFQNEGDDSGALEAAVAGTETGKGAWKKVAAVKLEPSDITQPNYTPGYCTPRPETHVQGFEEIKGDFSAFAGKSVLVRFNLTYGSENRQTSFPCGWYVDDLAITTTGTPGNLGTRTEQPPATPPAAGKPKVKVLSLTRKGRLRLTLADAELKSATFTLLKGRRKVATAKAASLQPGTRTVRLKARRRLAKGRYTLRVAGTYGDGQKFAASSAVRAR